MMCESVVASLGSEDHLAGLEALVNTMGGVMDGGVGLVMCEAAVCAVM